MVDDGIETQTSRPVARLLSLGSMAAGAGLVIDAATAGFFWLITQMIDAIWIDLPDALDITSRWYALVVCSVGGLLVGLGQKYLGNHPALLNELMSNEEGAGGFDARILPQALFMLLVSLAFGGAVGPELSLVFVTGTVGLAMAARLRNAEMVAAARDVSIAAVFGAMFASPLGGTAVAVEDLNAERLTKGERVAVAAIAALLAILSFNWVPTPGLAVVADWPSYESPRTVVRRTCRAGVGQTGDRCRTSRPRLEGRALLPNALHLDRRRACPFDCNRTARASGCGCRRLRRRVGRNPAPSRRSGSTRTARRSGQHAWYRRCSRRFRLPRRPTVAIEIR
jgi:hypothetical protein